MLRKFIPRGSVGDAAQRSDNRSGARWREMRRS